jgi:predicted RNA-binding protein with PIN domain
MVRAEIFFDRAAPGAAGRQKHGRVSAVFVPSGKTADHAIIQWLKAQRRAARSDIVVSSDRRVRAEARALGASVLDSGSFALQMREVQVDEGAGTEPALSEGEIQEWLSIFEEARGGDT